MKIIENSNELNQQIYCSINFYKAELFLNKVRKDNFRTFLAVFSLVNLFFIPEWVNFFGEGPNNTVFMTPNPLENAYLALGSVVFGVSLLLFVLIRLFYKFKLTFLESSIFLGLLLCLFVPLNFLRECSALFNYYPELSYKSHWLAQNFIKPLKIPLVFVFAFGFYKLVRHRGEQISNWIKILGLIFSPVIVITHVNLVKLYRENRIYFNSRNIGSKNDHLSKRPPKVIWIIFDEMDYRLVFEQRPPKIKLPEIDRFRKEVVFFEKAYPPSDFTVASIPSLFLGERINVSSVEATDLVFLEPGTNKEMKWTQAPHLGKETKKLGYSTSVIGWYHQYCKSFHHELDYCRTFPAGRFDYGTNFGSSVKAILERSFVIDKRLERAFIFNLSEIHASALEQIKGGLSDVLFLHYSVPHKPYLYDQTKKAISPHVERTPENYFGNLILVDQILGDITKSLQAAKKWNETVLIISADHSWRKSEEYDGKRDFRVPFMIKMADGKAINYTKPIPNLITKEIILEIMKGNLNSSTELVSWLDRHNKVFPKGTVLTPIEEENHHSLGRETIHDFDPKG